MPAHLTTIRRVVAGLSLSLLCLWLSVAPSLQSQPTPAPTRKLTSVPPGYSLTFDDEFADLSISDGNGAKTRWYAKTVECCMFDTSAPKTPTSMASVGSSAGQSTFALVPQGLRIRLQKINGGWTSGVLATVDHDGNGFAQQYGYFEVKAKFPAAKGTWPAIWMLNAAALQHHAPAGEIDLVESYMFAPRSINTTLHDWTPPGKELAHHLAQVANLSEGFHTFALWWTAETMRFYCDGDEIYTTPTPAIMQQPYYVILDLGLGGGWPTDETPAQSDMLVRYVRVYSPTQHGHSFPAAAHSSTRSPVAAAAAH